MSFVRSAYFSDSISAVLLISQHSNETAPSTKTALQAESEGAFFSSESAEKNRTGWFGQSVT
jgi:hypothetical protein